MNRANFVKTFAEHISNAEHIVIIQADNPDADSLGSALALEQVLTEQKKDVSLYCGVEVPTYLHYMNGWSRVSKLLPSNFDLCIIVDASTRTLLEKIESDAHFKHYLSVPKLVLDHHSTTQDTIDDATILNDSTVSSTGELIFGVLLELTWHISKETGEYILCSILGDTQGLSNNLASAQTFRIVADLIDIGVNRVDIEDRRRSYNKMIEEIFRYKATLINHTITTDSKIAYVVISQQEINTFSPLYNPAALIQPDMLQIDGVLVSIVFKCYADGKITAAIRCNNNAPIADRLAAFFGGGGHVFASGFKLTDGRPFNEIKSECLKQASELLENVK